MTEEVQDIIRIGDKSSREKLYGKNEQSFIQKVDFIYDFNSFGMRSASGVCRK